MSSIQRDCRHNLEKFNFILARKILVWKQTTANIYICVYVSVSVYKLPDSFIAFNGGVPISRVVAAVETIWMIHTTDETKFVWLHIAWKFLLL